MNNNIRKILKDKASRYKFELDVDAVGLWQIVKQQERFDLSDNDVQEHIYDSVMSLIKAGAKPVQGGRDGYNWAEIDTYGISAKDIAKNISNLWEKNINLEDSIFDLGGLWFAKPIPGKKYVLLLENQNKTQIINDKKTSKTVEQFKQATAKSKFAKFGLCNFIQCVKDGFFRK